jgi:hypothetical protein
MSTYGYIVSLPLAIDLPPPSIARSPLGEMHVHVAYEELPPGHTGIARDQPKWGFTPPRARLRFSVELSAAPSCRRIVFEIGRMAPILFHGLSQLGLPVVCLETAQCSPLLSEPAKRADSTDARRRVDVRPRVLACSSCARPHKISEGPHACAQMAVPGIIDCQTGIGRGPVRQKLDKASGLQITSSQ